MKKWDASDPGFAERLASWLQNRPGNVAVEETVTKLLTEVRQGGDAAVGALTERFDGVSLSAAERSVSPQEMAEAWGRLDEANRQALESTHEAVTDFHQRTLPISRTWTNPHGATVGERYYPLERVGLYVPGGRVPLVSTVLMTVTLARLAGCPEIVVTTPPGPDGAIHPGLLAALHLSGAAEVYRVGGVQAIGALAFGTETIRPVDKIYGPGNAYVTEAKRQVFGTTGVDLLPGPSEVMVIADATARADWVAADLLAQAEHGSGKERIYLVATAPELIPAVEEAVAQQLPQLTHAESIRPVLEAGTILISAANLDVAATIANQVAPEHLELHTDPAAEEALLQSIRTAGSILLGASSPTVLGDFAAGPSHTLPTNATGRFFSGLRIDDFLRRTSLIRYEKEQLAKAAPTVRQFAAMENLDAHGHSLELRLQEGSS